MDAGGKGGAAVCDPGGWRGSAPSVAATVGLRAVDAEVCVGRCSVQCGVLFHARQSRDSVSGVRAVAGMDLDLDGTHTVRHVVVFFLSHFTFSARDSAACGRAWSAYADARDCCAAVASRAI